MIENLWNQCREYYVLDHSKPSCNLELKLSMICVWNGFTDDAPVDAPAKEPQSGHATRAGTAVALLPRPRRTRHHLRQGGAAIRAARRNCARKPKRSQGTEANPASSTILQIANVVRNTAATDSRTRRPRKPRAPSVTLTRSTKVGAPDGYAKRLGSTTRGVQIMNSDMMKARAQREVSSELKLRLREGGTINEQNILNHTTRILLTSIHSLQNLQQPWTHLTQI